MELPKIELIIMFICTTMYTKTYKYSSIGFAMFYFNPFWLYLSSHSNKNKQNIEK